MKLRTPLVFSPVYKDYLWGGNRIAQRFDRHNPPTPCAESWEISSHCDGMSVVSGGAFDGVSLAELVTDFGADLIGRLSVGNKFPLLIKIIDAKLRLSVQVHPNEETASRFGGEPKTEMWYVLAADEGASVYAGLKQGTTAASLHQHILDGRIEQQLERLPVCAGQYVFIPGGTLHAIAEGCLLLEVQQNSNTTYRVYDWDRMDADGNPRDLHIDQALKVIDCNTERISAGEPSLLWQKGANRYERVISCDQFTVDRLWIEGPQSLGINGDSFAALFCEWGTADVMAGDESVTLRCGMSCLIPAVASDAALHPGSDGARVLVTSL